VGLFVGADVGLGVGLAVGIRVGLGVGQMGKINGDEALDELDNRRSLPNDQHSPRRRAFALSVTIQGGSECPLSRGRRSLADLTLGCRIITEIAFPFGKPSGGARFLKSIASPSLCLPATT